MRSFIQIVAVLCLIFSASTSYAQAEKNDSSGSIEWQTLVIPRINPLGLFAANSLSYRIPLYDSESPLLKTNFLRFAFQPWISPSWFRPGARLDVQPLSILKLSLLHEFIFHFGSFGILQSFNSPDADYSDDRLQIGRDNNENYTPLGQQTTVAALLQAKVGPIAIRNNFKLIHTNYDLRQGDSAFYDQFLDLLLPGEGWSFADDIDLLFLTDFGLIAGLRYTITQAYYDQGEQPATHRLGPLITFKFLDHPNAALSEVSGILLANWWLKHPYRTGQETSQFIPYLGVGVKLAGTLY